MGQYQDKKAVLPNGLEIFHLNQHETDFVYHEVFEEEVYLKHGITLEEGDCIFDIGANIGMFSLLVLNQLENVKIVAFEPSPEVCGILKANTSPYGDKVVVEQMGVGEKTGEAVFTYYPGYSILSGFAADSDQDKGMLLAGMQPGAGGEFANQVMNRLASEKLREKVEYTCRLTSVSEMIDRHDVQCIHLLKLDAEKSELAVLRGIDDDDWPKIQQIVMEVHDTDGSVQAEVLDILESRGFGMEVEQEENFHESGIVNIFARRENRDTIVVASTFTTDLLSPGLDFWKRELRLRLDVEYSPYNQVFQELLNPGGSLLSNAGGMNVILLKWDDWLRFRSDTFSFAKKDKKYLESTFKEFCDALKSYSELSSCYTTIILCPPAEESGKDGSFKSVTKKLERSLQDLVARLNGVELLMAEGFHPIYRVDNIFDSFTDELGHIPYTKDYYHFLATLVMRRYHALKSKPYKALVMDCDNTLWEGVCGEVGPLGVTVEGMVADLQSYLVRKSDEGFLVCLCSKNSPEDVWNVFEQQPGMILKKEHIVDSRVNWMPKSENLKSLAESLNLGIDSFVFFDDNPVECADARINCPEVLTLQWPLASDDSSFLRHIWPLDNFSVTEEDKKRKASYQANVEREKLLESSYDFHDFLE